MLHWRHMWELTVSPAGSSRWTPILMKVWYTAGCAGNAQQTLTHVMNNDSQDSVNIFCFSFQGPTLESFIYWISLICQPAHFVVIAVQTQCWIVYCLFPCIKPAGQPAAGSQHLYSVTYAISFPPCVLFNTKELLRLRSLWPSKVNV